jgi:hypothetical protein
MNEPYMTMAEIEEKYPNEWVLIANPTNQRKVIGPTGGIVVVHSPNRAEYLRLVGEWDDPEVKHVASWYTGRDWSSGFETSKPESGVA